MKTIIAKMSIIGLIVLMMASCKKDPEMPGGKFVNIKTNEVTEITGFSAAVSAYVGGDCDERGVCWSESDNPTIDDSYVSNGKGKGDYTCSLTNLTPNKKYYCKAYGKCGTKYVYSQQTKNFTTKDGLPTIVTGIVSDITATSAKCSGEVTDDGGAAIMASGVCWSTSQNPTVSNSHTTDGSGTGTFTSNITGLTENTTYYVRAYATNSKGTSYGEQKSFIINYVNDHEYVDLGLPSGLLWATCNVGADSPEDYGDYFAWGETTTKSTYNWSTYKWCDGSAIGLTKYCPNSSYGTVDNKTVLDPEDDAARANWGGDWRMPTEAELRELEDKCTWTWTTQGGKNGYRVTGPNGKSIFLPAAGYYSSGSLIYAGSGGYYWSSSLYTDYPSNAYDLDFNSGYVYMNYNDRGCGQSVRPVCPSQK